MKLKIYTKDGVLKTEVASDESSSHQVAIQGDNLLNLSFTLYECIKIDVNDYIDFCGERFWAVERYVPEQISTVEWKYSLKMFGIQSLISRFLVLKLVDGENEPAFSLTAPAATHLQLIVDSINAGMGTSDWKSGECVQTENIVLDYTGTYCSNALTALAEKAGTEYWFDGTTVNLTRCEHGAPVILAYGHGLTSLMRTGADNVKFFTRLFPVGSDRNIDRTKYGHTRLQLPDGIRYIDRDIESYGIIHHYEKDAFSHIYPRRVGKVSSVRVTDAKSDDGTPYKIYWFKDNSLDFNPDEYEIGGLVKQVTFQSGELNGREFEVNWHEDKKEFEIITQWPYDDGRQVPGDPLVPKPGDEYILWNIRMPDEYYPLAEQEFLNAVNSYMEEHKKDVSVFKSHTDYIDLNSRGISLTIGQRVRLESAQYFAGGYKETRITRISRSLDNPADADIEISDVLSKGTITEIQDGIEETKSYVDSVSGSLPGIVKSWEGTKLTDTNLMSSARTLLEIARKAVSKEHDDSAGGVITFLKGLVSELKIHALKGIEVGNYQAGKPGAGGAVLVDQEGNSRAEVDYLDVRKVAKFQKLMIQETKHIGGRLILSHSSMTCSRVEETESSYKCYFETTDGDGNRVFNQFEAGDQAIRQTFNLTGSVYYWRLVVAVGDDYIELSKTDCDSGSGVPQKGDEIVQLGNRSDKTRQSAQILSAYGSGSPSYEVFNGIDSYSLAGKNIAGIVYNEDTGEPQTYCYGDSYTGDRDIDDPDATFMTFQKKAGEDRKKLHVQAELTIGSGSSGLSNLSEWAGKQQEIDNAQAAADKAKEEAAQAQTAAAKAQKAADAAKGAADAAQTTADSAASSASSANSELSKLKSDGSINPVEKTALKQQLSDINAEYAQITADADKYSVSKTAYTSAYNAAKAALTKYSAVSPEYIDIDSDYANISTYYTARQTILNAIASAAKKVAVDAQNAADAAQSSADEAMTSAGTAQDTANDAQKTADEALRKAQEAKDYIDSTLPEEIAEINRKIDGVVENWYCDYTPSLTNAPASGWTTDKEKKKHIGDTFTNTQSFIDTETTPDAGKSWRWVGDGSYRWFPIADSDAVKALQEAAKAQDTADAKRRCFVTTPYTPYDVGDMWMQGSGGDIMRCIKSRATGAYTSSDWDKASKYSDDTAAKTAQAAAAKAQKAADAAKGAADAAQTTADSAASSASSANSELSKLKSDGSINPVEKTALKQQLSDINAEYAQITADADKYSVSKTAYTSAYNAAKAALTKYSAVSPEYIDIDSDYANISAYYTARQTILNAIASAAKKVAVDAQNAADAAQSSADEAANKAVQAQAAADAAKTAATQAGKVASDAAARLDDWANDAKISPNEKSALKDEISRIDADKTQILSGYAKYSMGTPDGYVSSHTVYRAQLVTLTAATPENIAIPSNFRSNQSKYYSDRSAVLDAISAAAKEYAKEYADKAVGDINIGGVNLILRTNQGNISWRKIQAAGYTASIESVIVADGTNGVRLTISSVPSSGGFSVFGFLMPETLKKLKPNTEYVLSFDAISSVEKKYSVSIVNMNGSNPLINKNSPFDLKTGLNHVEVKITTNGLTVPIYDQVLYFSTFNVVSTTDIWNLKLEEGNKATVWTAAPEDVIEGYTEAANNALENSKHYTDEAKAAVQSAINQLESSKADLSNVYTRSQADGKIDAAEASAIAAAKKAADTADALLQETVNAYADGKVTEAEKRAIAEAQKKADAAKEDAQILSAAAAGKMVYDDPEFAEGYNNVKVYNIEANNAVTITRKQIDGIPNNSGYGIEINTKSEGLIYPGLGGFAFEFKGKNYGEYVCRFIAKVPAGYTILLGTNSLGQGYESRWLTPNVGTGNWNSYAYYIKYGSGNIDTTFYFFLGVNVRPVTWQIAYATVFDLAGNSQENVKEAQAAADKATKAVSDLDTYIDGAFRDGVIDSAESISIGKYINTVESGWKELEASYDVVYQNPALTGTAKTNLLNAKISLAGKKDGLISAINTAVSSPTSSNITAVDTAFTAYNTSAAAFKTALENANKAIADAMSQADRNNANTSVENSKDAMAKNLGYASWSEMVEAAEAGKTVTKGGYINTRLIEAASIVADMIAAKAITADKIDLVNLFAQAIVASRLTLSNGCKIGDGIRIENGGIVIDLPDVDGSIKINEKDGIVVKFGTWSTQIGGCGGAGVQAIGDGIGMCPSPLHKVGLVAQSKEDGYAIMIPGGLIAGYRTPVNVASTSSYTIKEYESQIIARYPSSQTIYLPPRPRLGTTVRIINDKRRGSNRLTVNGNGKLIEAASGYGQSNVWTAERYVLEYVYDGEVWHQILSIN